MTLVSLRFHTSAVKVSFYVCNNALAILSTPSIALQYALDCAVRMAVKPLFKFNLVVKRPCF